MGFSKQEYWSGLPFPCPVDHIVSDLSTMPAHLGWPHMAWLSFIELDKAVVLVWLDWLVFCDYGFSVSALWCPFVTPTILLGFLLPWMWGISSRLLQQSAATAPYLGQGVSPHCCPSWPWTWSSSSWPSCARAQPPLLGCGVAHLGRRTMIEARSDAVKSNIALGPGILGPWIKKNWKWSNRRWREWMSTF